MQLKAGLPEQSRSSKDGVDNQILLRQQEDICYQYSAFEQDGNGRPSKIQMTPGNKRLSNHQELALCQYLERLDNIGLHARRFMITDCANAILRRSHLADSVNPPPQVGGHWARRILERHPEYLVHKQRVQEIDRKNAQDPDTIRERLQKFETICDESEIPPQDIYNFDESGFRIGVGRNQWIITRIFDRTLSLGSNTNRESVTVCETISGDGCVLPPVVILSGAIHQERWYTRGIDDDTLLAVSDTGYSNDMLSLEWLKHFKRFLAQRQ